MFKVEKNIETPTAIFNYPFKDMDIGDSFSYPSEFSKKVRASASDYGKRHKKKFITRKEETDSRCWRIE